MPRTSGAALPSGLGAGGKGKDKAPCRYLHFEVDYDEVADAKTDNQLIESASKLRLDIGNGPSDSNEPLVREGSFSLELLLNYRSFHLSGLTAICGNLMHPLSENFTLSWLILPGISI